MKQCRHLKQECYQFLRIFCMRRNFALRSFSFAGVNHFNYRNKLLKSIRLFDRYLEVTIPLSQQETASSDLTIFVQPRCSIEGILPKIST